MKLSDKITLEGLASVNQGNVCFGKFAGAQCLSNCVMYLLASYYNKETPITLKEHLDEVLFKGSKLDFILRRDGVIRGRNFAQLSNIPGIIRARDGVFTIFKSEEFYGLLNRASEIEYQNISAFTRLLQHRVNKEVTYYFILINKEKSLAVIRTPARYYLFDPHCPPLTGGRGPAYVISSVDITVLSDYIGKADEIYTGCFLFFHPTHKTEVTLTTFLREKYGRFAFSKDLGLAVDLDGDDACRIKILEEECPFEAAGAPPQHGSATPGDPRRPDDDIAETIPTPSRSGAWKTHSRHHRGSARFSPYLPSSTSSLSGNETSEESHFNPDHLPANEEKSLPTAPDVLHPTASSDEPTREVAPRADGGPPRFILAPGLLEALDDYARHRDRLPSFPLNDGGPPLNSPPPTSDAFLSTEVTRDAPPSSLVPPDLARGQEGAAAVPSPPLPTVSDTFPASPVNDDVSIRGDPVAATNPLHLKIPPMTHPIDAHTDPRRQAQQKRRISPPESPTTSSSPLDQFPRDDAVRGSVKKQKTDPGPSTIVNRQPGTDQLPEKRREDGGGSGDDGRESGEEELEAEAEDEDDTWLYDDEAQPLDETSDFYLSDDGDDGLVDPSIEAVSSPLDDWILEPTDLLSDASSLAESGLGDRGGGGGSGGLSWTFLDETLEKLARIEHHVPDLPRIANPESRLNLREASALADIDKILTGIVIEGGLITPDHEEESSAIDLLKLLLIWGRKLGIPTEDLNALYDSGLRVDAIHGLLTEGRIGSESLRAHLINKLNRCSDLLKETQTPLRIKLLSWLQHQIKLIPTSSSAKILSRDEVESELLGEFRERIFIVLNEHELGNLRGIVGKLAEIYVVHNRKVYEDQTHFQHLLMLLNTFQGPPSEPWQPDFDLAEKAAEYQTLLTTVSENLSLSIEEACREFLNGINNAIAAPEQIIFSVPDFNELLKKIQATVDHVDYTAGALQLRYEAINPTRQRLLYYGWELALISNLPWDRDPVTVETPLEIFAEIQARQEILKNRHNQREELTRILDEAELILQSLASSGETTLLDLGEELTSGGATGPEDGVAPSRSPTPDLYTLPVLENYLANAGALSAAGDGLDRRFADIQERIQDLATSETFLNSLILNTTYETLAETMPRLREAVKTKPSVFKIQSVHDNLNAAAVRLISHVIQGINEKRPGTSELSALTLLQSFLKFSDLDHKEEIGQILTSLGTLQPRVETSTVEKELRAALEEIEVIKNILRASTIVKELKSEFLSILTKNETSLKRKLRTCEILASFPIAPESGGAETSSRVSAGGRTAEPEEMDVDVNEASDSPRSPGAATSSSCSSLPLPARGDDDLSRFFNEDSVPQLAEASWNKIKLAFENLVFGDIGEDDWKYVLLDFKREESTLAPVLGASLNEALVRVERIIDESSLQRLRTLLASDFPESQTPSDSDAPGLDWLADFQNNVLVKLSSLHLPMIDAQRLKLERKISDLLIVRSGATWGVAIMGTTWQDQGLQFQEFYSSLKTTSLEYTMQLNYEVDNFMKSVHLFQNPPIPGNPVLLLPKTFLTVEQERSTDSWIKTFREALGRAETYHLKELAREIDRLKDKVKTFKETLISKTEEYLQRMYDVVANSSPRAGSVITSTLKKLKPGKPLDFLEGLLHEYVDFKAITYREEYDLLSWIIGVTTQVATVAPVELKPRLDRVVSESGDRLERLRPLLELEDRAKETEDAVLLQRAIDNLDPARVTGGKTTVAGWAEKIEASKELLRISEEKNLLLAEFDLLLGRLFPDPFPYDTRGLADSASALRSKLTARVDEDATGLRTAVEELTVLALEKHRYLETVLSENAAFLRSFPIGVPLPGEDDAARSAPGPVDAWTRLKLLAAVATRETPTVWCGVSLSLDPTEKTFAAVTASGQKKDSVTLIHYAPFLATILDLLQFFNRLDPARWGASDASPPPGPPVLIPSVVKSRSRIEPANALRRSWPDVEQVADQVLETLSVRRLSSDDLSANELIAMIVSVLLVRLFSEPLIVRARGGSSTTAPTKETLLVPFQHWAVLVLAVIPEAISAALERASLREAYRYLTRRRRKIEAVLETSFIHRLLTRESGESGVVRPRVGRSYLMVEDYFIPSNVTKFMWNSPTFQTFAASTGRDELLSRVQLLCLQLHVVHETVVRQLWHSLQPSIPGINTPGEFFHLLLRERFGRTEVPSDLELPAADATQTAPEDLARIFSPTRLSGLRRLPTATATAVDDPALRRGQKGTTIPITAFEVALCALFHRRDVGIYVATNEPIPTKRPYSANPQSSTPTLRVVSLALHCHPEVEPFKSLAGVPKSVESLARPLSSDEAKILTPQERLLFRRQIYWLASKIDGLCEPANAATDYHDHAMVTIDSSNLVISGHLQIGALPRSRDFVLAPDPSDDEPWSSATALNILDLEYAGESADVGISSKREEEGGRAAEPLPVPAKFFKRYPTAISETSPPSPEPPKTPAAAPSSSSFSFSFSPPPSPSPSPLGSFDLDSFTDTVAARPEPRPFPVPRPREPTVPTKDPAPKVLPPAPGFLPTTSSTASSSPSTPERSRPSGPPPPKVELSSGRSDDRPREAVEILKKLRPTPPSASETSPSPPPPPRAGRASIPLPPPPTAPVERPPSPIDYPSTKSGGEVAGTPTPSAREIPPRPRVVLFPEAPPSLAEDVRRLATPARPPTTPRVAPSAVVDSSSSDAIPPPLPSGNLFGTTSGPEIDEDRDGSLGEAEAKAGSKRPSSFHAPPSAAVSSPSGTSTVRLPEESLLLRPASPTGGETIPDDEEEPTVHLRYPQIEDAFRVPPRTPLVSTFFDNTVRLDLSDLRLEEKTIQEAKIILISFIENIKQRLIISNHVLLATIQRIKAFYLYFLPRPLLPPPLPDAADPPAPPPTRFGLPAPADVPAAPPD